MSTDKKEPIHAETVDPAKGAVKVISKGLSDDGMQVGNIAGFACSQRTKAIDYAALVQTAISILGPKFSIGWACKLNNHGQKLKPGDFVKIGSEEMTVEKFQEALATQKGWAAYQKSRSEGTQKISNKDLLTVGRLCRAFAKSTIKMIQAGKDKPEEDISALAASSGLPLHFAFLSSPYAMTDEEIKEHDAALVKFFTGFDAIISDAYSKEWVKGNTKRKHLAEYENLKVFRGIGSPAK